MVILAYENNNVLGEGVMSDYSNPFTQTFPLGPSIAPPVTDRERLQLLFDAENKLVNQLNSEKSLIIGRKGSGKTTLLSSVLIANPPPGYVYLPPSEASDLFAKIIRAINELSQGVTFVEQVSRLWEFVLWGPIFPQILLHQDIPQLRDFCTRLNIQTDASPYEIVSEMLKAIRGFPPQDWPLPEKISYKKIGGLSFLQAKRIAVDVLKEKKSRVYMLLDSLEDLDLDIPAYAAAIAGLLRCLGEFNEQTDGRVILRCCLPAERYFDYQQLSTNPLKDFRYNLLLHWSAGELIHLSAIRYAKYLEKFEQKFYNHEIKRLNFKRREDLLKFWNLIMPNVVKNRLDIEENPLAYVLRHTQLLPRHFIVYLNEIISRSIHEDGKAYGIDARHIKSGVAEKEQDVYAQICQAYRGGRRYNPFEVAPSVLRNLRNVFERDEFDDVAGREGIRGIMGRTELLGYLSEIGAIGRVVDDTEKYVEGVFEYMVPSRLVYADRDRFCIHPVFSEICHVDVEFEGAKPVYTYWSGITDSDLAFWR